MYPGMKKKKRPKKNQAQLPVWWMELTPHYTLDVDDEYARRMYEEKMARYYAEIAVQEAANGALFDVDGNRLESSGADDTRASGSGWKSNWAGRSKKDGGDGAKAEPEKPKMFGGRNYKPGSEGWDPKQWGIEANDPEYAHYQSGEKLPPQFLKAMENFAKATGHYKPPGGESQAGVTLNQVGGAHYGEEKPDFQPSWAKAKLRSTTQGTSIRVGAYDDSPNKHLREPRVKPIPPPPDQPQSPHKQPSPPPQQQQKKQTPPVVEQKEETIQKASFTFTQTQQQKQTPPVVEENEAPKQKSYTFKSYYHNASSDTPKLPDKNIVKSEPASAKPNKTSEPVAAVTKTDPIISTLAMTESVLPDPDKYNHSEDEEDDDEEDDGGVQVFHAQSSNHDQQHQHHQTEVEEEYVEETVQRTEVREEVDEEVSLEEYVDEDDEVTVEDEITVDEGSLEDLQATLAAKMAELKRLQGAQ